MGALRLRSVPDFFQQRGTLVEQFQQLDERKRWPGLAGFVSGERIDAAAKNVGSLSLVERQFLSYAPVPGVSDRVRPC